MPTENRIVTFTDAEIMEAIASYCVKTGRIAAHVKVTSPVVTNDGELSLSFEPFPAGPRIALHESELLSAIILYCNGQGIPIARRSTKSLEVAKNSFSLHLSTPR
jgi:hypothetical protein